MTTSTEETKPSVSKKTLIRLTRIKQWYIVADVESYMTLKKLGAPMIRVHQNFLPTLQLLTKKNKVNAVSVDFESEILDPFLEKTAATWTKKYGKCTITSRVMVFQAQDARVGDADKAVANLEARLQSFFSRWGYKFSVQYSKNRQGTRLKFHVEYWFDPERMPILPLEVPVEEVPKVQFKIGFTRLTFSFENPQARSGKAPKVHLLVEVSQGGKFTPIHSTNCLYSQLSSVKPLVNALMNVMSVDIHNLDNEAE